jgi:outer membrane protein OmpA-like peptidoglycan-associated protein
MTFTASPRRFCNLALWGLAVALVFTGINGTSLAQDQTVVVGDRVGSPVQVDLSVLDSNSGWAPTGQRDLLFPGSTFKPGQRIILRRPGTRQKRVRLRKPRRQPARRSTRRTVAAPPKPAIKIRRSRRASAPPPPPSVVMRAAKPRIKPKKKMAAAAKVKPNYKPRSMAKAVVPSRAKPKPPSRAKPKPKSRATANLKAPPLTPPAMKKPKPTAAPPRPAIPPTPPAPRAARKPAPAPRRMTAVPPPPPPPVAAAPRAPVTAKPLAKKKPATTKAKSPRTQVASIPRLGAITSGSKLQVLFAPASARLESDAKTVLGPVSAALAKNSKLRVELKAYARGNAETVSQARRLSLSRALAIRSHLIKGGVRATRIDVRALGSKVPNGVPNRVDLLVFTR